MKKVTEKTHRVLRVMGEAEGEVQRRGLDGTKEGVGRRGLGRQGRVVGGWRQEGVMGRRWVKVWR